MPVDKSMFDIVILTDNRYVNPTTINYLTDNKYTSNSISSKINLSPKSLKKLPELYSTPHFVLSILIFAVAEKLDRKSVV